MWGSWDNPLARATRGLRRMGKERPGALLARRAEEGMEPDDLPCSRNARPPKALVGRAQWKINQAPSLERERASLEGSIRWMTVVRCAQLRAALATPLKGGRGNWKALARANGTSRRASGWARENVVRSWNHPSHPLSKGSKWSLAAALLSGLFEHPARRSLVIPDLLVAIPGSLAIVPQHHAKEHSPVAR